MSKDVDVSAKGFGGKEIVMTGKVKWGETPEESIEMFGGEALDSNAQANAVITVRAIINRNLKAGKTPEEIQVILNEWKLGISTPRAAADPVAAMMGRWGKMDPEAKKAFMAQLKAAA
jgi:hypothetical protein